MRILGLEAGNKESAAALVIDGRLVGAALEERYSRRRFDDSLPVQAARALLTAEGLTIDDVDVVTGNVSAAAARDAMGGRAKRQPDFPMLADGPETRGFHHLSHAVFAWACSGLRTALIVTVDNHGDDDTLVVFEARDGGMQRLGAIPWKPAPIGGVYEDATGLLGFGVGGEGKLMGLAGYGVPDPSLSDALLRRTGQWSVASDLLGDDSARFDQLARAPWAPIRRPEHPNFAASVQRALEQTVIAVVRDAVSATGIQDICLAGGVALNCSLNGAIAKQEWAGRVFVPPSPADPGNSAGAALLWAWRCGASIGRPLRDGGLGTGVRAEDAVSTATADGRFDVELVGRADSDAVAGAVAADIANGRLVGWFEGRAEFGPRALGHRSMLADPRSPEVADRLNDAKLRERWRPVAPSILAGAAGPWLQQRTPSPFMLLAFEATERARDEAPAAVHVDGTTRAQTVHPEQAAYHRMIRAFEAATGVPMVLNTSFNQAGEPIVQSATDALDCAARAGLDVLWIDGARCTPQQRHEPVDTRPRRPRVALAGPVGGHWPIALCRQTSVRADGHIALVDAEPFAVEALGLAQVDAPRVVLTTGLPERALANVFEQGAQVIVGASSRWDRALPPNVFGATPSLASPGVAAIRRNFRPDRLGSVHRLHIDMPSRPGRLTDPALADSLCRQTWAILAEGVALARWLADEPLPSIAIHGERPESLTAHVHGVSGDCEATVTMAGKGPLPVIRADNEKGNATLEADGTFVVSLHGRGRRSVDTPRGEAGFFEAVAQLTNGGSWPWSRDLLHRAGSDLDEAMTAHFRQLWAAPGDWGQRQRALAADGASPPPRWSVRHDAQQTHAEPAPTRLVTSAHLASIAARCAAVASGRRGGCTYENATEETAAVVERVAAALGLHVRRLGRYHCAVTEQAGQGGRFTLVVGSDGHVDAIAALLQAQHAAPGDVERRDLQRQLGQHFGYPTCCVAAWHRWSALKLAAAFTYAIAEASAQPLRWGCNARPPARLADHLPCSFSCRATQRAAEADLAALVRHWPVIEAALRSDERTVPGLITGAGLPTAETLADDVRAVLDAPLLYIDTTRYLCFIGATARPSSDGGWRIEGGSVLGSPALIGAGQVPEEAVLQRQLAESLQAPVAAALRRGPLVVGCEEGVDVITGAGLQARAPAGTWRLLAFNGRG